MHERPHTAQETRPKSSKAEAEAAQIKEESLKDINESGNSEDDSLDSKENREIIASVLKEKSEAAYQNLIDEESNYFSMIAKQNANLDGMKLIESNIEGLYDWRTLFNKSRPLSSYIRLNPSSNSTQSHDKKEFRFPVALIDASEERVAHYIPNSLLIKPSSASEQKKSRHPQSVNGNLINERNETEAKRAYSRPRLGNATRPQSMYSSRAKTDTFYLSQGFSDYYTEDLKSFSKKVPLVQPRLQVGKKRRKLKQAIKALQRDGNDKEEKYKRLLGKETLALSPLLLCVTQNSTNCEALMKSISNQTHSNREYTIDKRGNVIHNAIKVKGVNEKQKKAKEDLGALASNSTRNKCFKSKGQFKSLWLPTYEETDPQLRIFKQIEERAKKNESNTQIIFKNALIQTMHTQNTSEVIYQSSHVAEKAKRPSTSQQCHPFLYEPQRSHSEAPFHPLSNSITITSSLRNITSQCSIVNTFASLKALNYIPKKSMPIRTISMINNATYQRIDQSIKSKRRHEALLNQLPPQREQGTTCESLTDRIRPKSSLLTLSQIKQNDKVLQIGRNKHQTIRQGHVSTWNSVNLIYFNHYIDTNFLKSNEDYNSIEPKNYVRLSQFKQFHKLNYFPVNCFNKGTYLRARTSKREGSSKKTPISKPNGNKLHQHNQVLSWKKGDCQ